MSLNVCIFCTEKLLSSFDSNGLNDINVLAAAVISLSGVALSILVGKNAAHSSHYCGRNDVLTGDKLKVSLLTCKLLCHSVADFGVSLLNKADSINDILVHF